MYQTYQIKMLTCEQCELEIDLIEGKAAMLGKKLTKAEEKTIKLLQARIYEFTDKYVED